MLLFCMYNGTNTSSQNASNDAVVAFPIVRVTIFIRPSLKALLIPVYCLLMPGDS